MAPEPGSSAISGRLCGASVWRSAIATLVLVWLSGFLGCVTSHDIYNEARAARKASYRAWVTTQRNEGKPGALLTGELPLQRAVEVACLCSKEIQVALQERARAEGKLQQGLSAALPSLTAYMSYYRLDEATGGTVTTAGTTLSAGDKNSYSQGFVLRQPLFHGGAISAAIRSAHIFDVMADEAIRAAVEKVIGEVARAYLDVQLSQKLSELSRNALLSAQTQLDSETRMKESGLATQFDVLRAQVEVSNIEANLIQQQNRTSLALLSLFRLMGVSQHSNVVLTTPLSYVETAPDLDEVVAAAFDRRPDLYQAEFEIMMQREDLRTTRSRYFPTVDAVLTQLWSKPDPHDASKIEWGSRLYGGVVMTWDLFDGMRREGEMAERRALLRQKELQLDALGEEVLVEVKQALLGIQSAAQLIKAQELNVKRAEEGLRLAMQGYPQMMTLVEVTDARAALVRAERFYWQAVSDHCLARLTLQQAMGMLAPEPGVREAPPALPRPARMPLSSETPGEGHATPSETGGPPEQLAE